MINNIFEYLFGEKTGKRLSEDEFACLFEFYTDALNKVVECIKNLAYYSREKEREICHLADLPDVSEKNALDPETNDCVLNLQKYEKYIKNNEESLNNSLPKLRRFVLSSKAIYMQAQQEAVECRILEEILLLHCASCKQIIKNYSDKQQWDQAQIFKSTMDNLISEYNAKILSKKRAFSLHINEFIKQVQPFSGVTIIPIEYRCVSESKKAGLVKEEKIRVRIIAAQPAKTGIPSVGFAEHRIIPVHSLQKKQTKISAILSAQRTVSKAKAIMKFSNAYGISSLVLGVKDGIDSEISVNPIPTVKV